MITSTITQKTTVDSELNFYAFRNIPNEITLLILKKLDLLSVHAFAATSLANLRLRQHLWYDFAKRFYYLGQFEGSQAYLKSFFSSIAEGATYNAFPNHWKVYAEVKFRKGKPTKNRINGYLTALNILSAPKIEIQNLLQNCWAYRNLQLLYLLKEVGGEFFKGFINQDHVKRELLIPASKNGDIEKIRLFCEWSENPNFAHMEFSPIHAAALAGSGDSIRVLCEYGALVNAVWEREERHTRTRSSAGVTRTYSYIIFHRHTALELAFDCKSESAVSALLENHARPNREFLRTCKLADERMLAIFLNLAPFCDHNKGLALCFRSSYINEHSLACAKLLLQSGANPNIVDQKGRSLLYRSVRLGSLDFIRLLHLFGADLESRCRKGKTALYVAIKEKNYKVKRVEMVRVLCELGSDINALGPKRNKTMLEHTKSNKKIFNVLLQFANDRNIKDSFS